MAYKRQVSEQMAESYALKNDMAFFEVSPLCDFNVTESFAELSRVALKRNGMRRTWGTDKGLGFFCHKHEHSFFSLILELTMNMLL